MDRFIGLNPNQKRNQCHYLKSNMDRFIVALPSGPDYPLLKFKIQYG